MPVNDSQQAIQFVIGGVAYQYIIEYPKSHYSCFINDLILFGQTITNEQRDFLRNPNKFVIEFWCDRNYYVKLI